MKQPRRFNRKQRLALAYVAGFRCEICGAELESFEADHVIPFSKGGETHVRNGQALCISCNRKKGNKTMHNLRKWQREAMEKILHIQQKGKDRALIAACPGAGKTFFTACVLTSPETKMGAECFVVVVPSRALKRQWKTALKKVGLRSIDDVDNGTLDERHKRKMDMYDPARPVIIVTYAQVASNPEIFAALCNKHKVFLVCDEIHHADDDATFGTALITAFDESVFKLNLSGTPFNTVGGTLAFCETREVIDDNGARVKETICDFEYSYGKALAASGSKDDPEVVRPVTFIQWEGSVWRDYFDDSDKSTFRRTYDGRRKNDPLTPMLDPSLDYLKNMIDEGLERLRVIRQHHANAGMLITAISGDHCREIEQLLRAKQITDYKTVLFDTPNAHDQIEKFESSRDRVLVAVKMISEGVDIKRLRVGVYASNVLTKMFFTQFVGRFIRWDSSLDSSQHAIVVIPNHVTIQEYALEIEEMVNASFVEDEGEEGGDGDGGDRAPSTLTILDKGGNGSAGVAIERGKVIIQDEREQLEEAMKAAGVSLSLEAMRRLKDHFTGNAPQNQSPSSSAQEERDIAKHNDKIVGRIVSIAARRGLEGYDFSSVNRMANNAVGIQRKDRMTSEDVLERRLDYLKRLLHSLLMGGSDDAAA